MIIILAYVPLTMGRKKDGLGELDTYSCFKVLNDKPGPYTDQDTFSRPVKPTHLNVPTFDGLSHRPSN